MSANPSVTGTVLPFPTFTQAARAESERNAHLEADNLWLEQRLVEATVANSDLAQHVIAAEERAEKAERWVRARVVEHAWPAVLGGIGGGFVLAGLLKVLGT